jgi:glycolate oxidase FAD binding subunit
MHATNATTVASVLEEATHTRQLITPYGAGTRQHIGAPPASNALKLDLQGMNHLLEYNPADLTATFESGITLAALQAELKQHQQWLPWLPPSADATIGGLLASAADGSLRLGYGTPRDWVLGMQVVLGDGRLVKSGGKVVKNVAGYDNHKLHLGALGTLGVIVEVTLKVFPEPQTSSTLIVECASMAHALQAAEALRKPPLAPVALVVTSPANTLSARFDGITVAVKRSVDTAQQTLALLNTAVSVSDGVRGEKHWQQLANWAAPSNDLVLRVGVKPSVLPQALLALNEHAPQHSALGLCAQVGVGLVHARWQANPAAPDHVQRLRNALGVLGGYAVVESAPDNLIKHLDIWGPVPPTFAIMQQIKTAWDPAGILNRGRYLGGI